MNTETDVSTLFYIGMDRSVPPWQHRHKGKEINLGIGNKPMEPHVESIGLPDWNANTDPLPYEDGSVSIVWALHFLEHIDDPISMLMECQRVLCKGGLMNIVVPYGACHMWVHDLTHKHMFNEDTWRQTFANKYYDDKNHPQGWKFSVGFNMILGVKGENLALFTQLHRWT